MKKLIKINFADFWPGFEKDDNYFYNLLKDKFDIEISSNPNYLFYSVFGSKNLQYNCKKIFYTGENISPNLNECDYSFSFDYMNDERNYRLPHYLLYDGYYDLVNKKVDDNLLKRDFCSFVVSNPGNNDRNKFFQELSKYKKIQSGGSVLNNTGYKVENKIDFISKFKFNITFENNAYRSYNEHYTTEKLPQSMQANTIGIYLGNTQIEKEFNKKSFIDVKDFNSYDDVIDYIIHLDKNDDEYMKKINEPWFNDNRIPDSNKLENIKEFLYKIFI